MTIHTETLDYSAKVARLDALRERIANEDFRSNMLYRGASKDFGDAEALSGTPSCKYIEALIRDAAASVTYGAIAKQIDKSFKNGTADDLIYDEVCETVTRLVASSHVPAAVTTSADMIELWANGMWINIARVLDGDFA